MSDYSDEPMGPGNSNRRGAIRLIVLGIVAIVYGLIIGPVVCSLLDFDIGTAFHVLCVALGMLITMFGVMRIKQWVE
ncbi:MAG: hypothetical protein GY778_01255 [bacterium]|nr:hypothetical protein [bacterium]